MEPVGCFEAPRGDPGAVQVPDSKAVRGIVLELLLRERVRGLVVHGKLVEGPQRRISDESRRLARSSARSSLTGL